MTSPADELLHAIDHAIERCAELNRDLHSVIADLERASAQHRRTLELEAIARREVDAAFAGTDTLEVTGG